MAKSFTLVQLRYFMAVARHENMRAAAHELNVTQSTLSAAIHQLEREVGVELFQRLSSRGLRLTGEGRRLLVGARTFLEDADQLYHSVRAEREELVGDLVVGIYSPIAPFHAPNILTAMERRHPGINLSFLEGDQETLMRALTDGTCEIAVMYDLGVGTEFGYRVLERIPPHIVVSADHPRAAQPDVPVHLRDFEDEPFILLDLKHTREYYLDMFKRLGLRPRIRHFVAGYETVRSYVGLGHGYSILNRRLVHDMTYAGARVVPLGLADDLPAIEVVLVRLQGARPTRKSLAFEQVCIDLHAGIGGED
ncbi:LysR family transcriptional regulator [Mycolicibacterium mageritense DSM 44476 = CIP 104973]|uniref:Probable hydrogen peroxide-inducible genes activator n=2 Tax=Mycolicibacterium TaxID=1866885 RepID=A0AAI8XLA6_MYCME|nr:LysR family transcriptional regulator [Mycolicibacterium mageritense]MBN3457148.1 LysR family transcriptional regulator [Mycobacterium sp. DSM 3803]OKH77272.1 LysR family transcriptional regulator [Mycobacterium sp. SWH-M3]MCC9180790.1 LysR family transcriptional regulator [Mycolicibacterium mageritense]CDO21065.1 LysR family transcriptional regulator [Mycolicibacterium mageritense DSM 44476 = CIP 104973]BBX34416.1 LysR family transcriptional regulator [Mycolicibacterium mageritense]